MSQKCTFPTLRTKTPARHGTARCRLATAPSTSQTIPHTVTRAGLYHLTGALPQLRSHNFDGPTVFALTVHGVKGVDNLGAASIAGPALDASGLASGWPAEAIGAARGIFERNAQRGGTVTVVVIVQMGKQTHCSLVNIPPDLSRRERSAQRTPAMAGANITCESRLHQQTQ
jgi:hypothetical protein